MSDIAVVERVDRLEALYAQFLTDMALLNQRADERSKLADERNRRADERSKLADERSKRADERLDRLQEEMRTFKDEMRAYREDTQAFKDEMRAYREDTQAFKEEMRAYRQDTEQFKIEMRQSKRDLDKKWGDLANKLGTIVEDILAPNLRRLAREYFGFEIIQDFMIRRSRRGGPGLPEETEFDTLVVGPTAVLLGEAKSSPSLEYAEAFAAKVRVFFDFFPEYAGRRLIPVFGSWAIADPVVQRLTAHRIYAMRMGEDTMELANAAVLDGPQPASRPPGKSGGGV